MPAPTTQRADPLATLPAVLAELGVPTDEVLAGTGLSVEDLAPGRFIAFGKLLSVLDKAVEATGREDLGILIGSRHRLDVLGPGAKVMRMAATLGEALSDFTALQSGNSTGAATYLHRHQGQLFFGYGRYDPNLRVSPALHDLVLAVGARAVAELTGGAVVPSEYLSMRQMPREPRHWAALGAPVRFGEAQTGFYLAPADFAYRLPSANPKARERALRALLRSPALAPAAWTHRTRHALRGLLLEERSGMPEVAVALGIEPRTLRRALAREGTTFKEVRDDVRLAMSRDLLAMSALSIADIALTLDFATPSAFIRAFRRWTGATPTAWRESHGGGAEAQRT